MTQAAMDIGQRELPAGWKWVKLGDVCEVNWGNTAITKASYIGKGFKAFSATGQDGFTDWYEHDSDGVVLSAIGANCGKCFRASGKWVAIKNTIVILAGNVDIDFLFHYLNQPTRWQISGSGQPFITIGNAKKVLIPLPPMEEQKRIAGILNRADEAKRAAEEQLEAAQALMQVSLREVFEGEDAKDWPVNPLGDIGEIAAGITLGRKIRSGDVREIPYLRVANLKDGYLDLEDVKEIEATESEIDRLMLRTGDLLLTEGGDPDKLGRGTTWKGEIQECVHQNHVYRIRFDETRFSSSFLSYQVGSSYGKAYFFAHAKQTTGIATMNQTVLKGFPFRVPPLPEQIRINNHLDSIKDVSDSITQQISEIEALQSSLLRKAFAGEL